MLTKRSILVATLWVQIGLGETSLQAVEETYLTGFENVTKGAYAAANVDLDGLTWKMENVLIGRQASDNKNGNASARFALREDGPGIMTLVDDMPGGIGVLGFHVGRFGTHETPVPFVVESSTDEGLNWVPEGGRFEAHGTPQLTAVRLNLQIDSPVRIRFRALADNPSAQGSFNLDDIVISSFDVARLKPAPTRHVEDLRGAWGGESEIRISWADVMDDPAPRGYLVQVRAEAPPALPQDGWEFPFDDDLTDGMAAVLVAAGEQYAAFRGAQERTRYIATVVPYTNRGRHIAYFTGESPSSTSVEVPGVLFRDALDTLDAWDVISLGGGREWASTGKEAVANALGSAGPADDWLISRGIQMDPSQSPVLRFKALSQFHDPGMDPALSVLVSQNFIGSGNPLEADWIELLPPLPMANSNTWMVCGPVDLSRFHPGVIHLAFRYRSSGRGASDTELWALRDVEILEASGLEALPYAVAEVEPGFLEVDGRSAWLNLQLSKPLAAPVYLTIRSRDVGLVPHPGELVLPANTTQGFIALAPASGVLLEAPQPVTLDVRGHQVSGGTITIEVRPAPERWIELTLDRSEVEQGDGEGAAFLTILFSEAPPAYPWGVRLGSDHEERIELPESVLLSSGLSVQVPVNTIRTYQSNTEAEIRITAIADRFDSGSALLRIWPLGNKNDVAISIEIVPSVLMEGFVGYGSISIDRPIDRGLWVGLSTSDPDQVTVPDGVMLPAGAKRVDFAIEARAHGGTFESSDVAIRAEAEGAAAATTILHIRREAIERTLELRAAATRVHPGDSIPVTLHLHPPLRRSGKAILRTSSSAIVVPEDVWLEADRVEIDFRARAVSELEFRPDQDVLLTAEVEGYPVAELTFVLRSPAPQAFFASPVSGEVYAVGERIPVVLTVAGPIGSVSRIQLWANEETVEEWEAPPFETTLTVDQLGSVSLAGLIVDPVSREHPILPVEVVIAFDPIRSDLDFVRQIYVDMLGRVPTEMEEREHLERLRGGTSREGVVRVLYEGPEFQRVRSGVAILWLLLGEMPIWQAFFEGLFSFEEPFGDDAPDGSPEGFLGATSSDLLRMAYSILHETSEVEERIGRFGDELKDRHFFEWVWQHRHGVLPTAQQVVQATHRMQVFRNERDPEMGDLEERAYGWARLALALLEEEVIDGLDVIYAPPNRDWVKILDTVSLWMTLWRGDAELRVPAYVGSADEALSWGAKSLDVRLRELLGHPNFWDRFGYSWLGSSRDEMSDWRDSDWFGWFYYNGGCYPWIAHLEHGWIYAGGDDRAGDGIWLFDSPLGWSWTSRKAYPWIFQSESADWLFFARDNFPPRWFYSLGQERWISY